MSDTAKIIDKDIQFKANVIIKGKIRCETGLHIGGSKEKMEIGGVDSPVLRNPDTNHPYIPGSSLKGKLRHLLEFSTGAITVVAPKSDLGDVSVRKDIVRIFGIGGDEKGTIKDLKHVGPSRLIVRDSHPDQKTITMWEGLDSELLYTEYKSENTIDRLTSEANPRFIERVVAGSHFDFELVYAVYKIDEADYVQQALQDLKNIRLALSLLENSALGKSGTRGYGQITFKLYDPIVVTNDDYKENGENYKESLKEIIEKPIKNLSQLEFNLPLN